MIRAQLLSARAVALAIALGLVLTTLPLEPSLAAGQRVDRRLFGMTDADPVSWPKAKIGAVRLWDSGVTWRQIETRPGVFDFSRLDAQVSAARAHGARPLLVLGMTPRFHAKRPNVPGVYGRGSTSPPKMSAWKRYVAKLANRYRGTVDYQVWNEANVAEFWRGSPSDMAELTKVTSKVVARHDKWGKIVSPALATRLTGQRKWLRTFYAQRPGGRSVAGWVDIVSLNLYPLPNQGPEASMRLLDASRTMLGALGVTKAIWNTEINYGLQTGGGGTAKNISRRKEAAFVGRTYVLNAANNVKRVFWYSWDIQSLANTQMTYRSGGLTPAGKGYSLVRDWLVGGRMQGCSRSGNGTYTCTVRYSGGVKRIYWNPSRRVTIRTDSSATRMTTMSGESTRIRGGKSIRVKFSPVMVRSRR